MTLGRRPQAAEVLDEPVPVVERRAAAVHAGICDRS